MAAVRAVSRFSLLRTTQCRLGAGAGEGFPCGKAAVLLSGCGVYDGSEILETVSIGVHLGRARLDVDYYAPDVQGPIVNHNTGADEPSTRSVLAESARITRGNVKPVSELAAKASEYEALFLPGGFGAAKNLSDFAQKGPDMTVNPDVAAAVTAFHTAGRPLAFACISPVIAAKVLPKGVKLTLGQSPNSPAVKEDASAWPYAGAADAARTMGANVHDCFLNDVMVDEQNKVVSTPAYMCGAAKPHEIYDGMGKLVHKALKLTPVV